MKNVFLDNCSTTPLCEVAKNIIVNNLDNFANPSSSYEISRKVNIQIEECRENIARIINAEPEEIFFTSGSSESNNWAISGADVDTVYCSNIEHSSILNNPSVLPIIEVNKNGIVDKYFYKSSRYRHVLTSIMMTNNETGVNNPIKELSEIIHDNGYIFHSDMTQSIPHMKIDVKDLNIDMASFSAHKFNGPKGVGFLYKKNGIYIDSLIYGGKQNFCKRGGTENVLGILAMASSLQDTVANLDETNERIAYLSTILEENLLNVSGVHDNVLAPKECRIPGILNLRIEGCKGADVVAMASEYGICISSGSACSEGNAKPSHVLKAIGLSDEETLSSIRISIGRYNTEEDIRYASDILPKIIKRLRIFK